jgi:purine-binding chemotaxis protein CheW
MTTQRQLCTFFLVEHYFGIDVHEVQEVLRHLEMARVPLAPPVVRGLINLRGQIVTAIDLRRRLDLLDRPEGKLPVNVVVKANDDVVSLLVDDIGDVLQVAEEAFERPPESLQGPARQMILGAYRLEDRLLLLLDTKKVLQIGSEA